MNKTAMQSYQAAESPVKALFRKQTVRDFKASTAIRLGEMGQLEELAENGEFTATSRGEEGETIKAKTYGRRLDVSRNLIVNDDLNLLGDTTRAFGEAAAQTEAALMLAIITGNPNLSDGTPVFDASRGNLGNAGGGAAGAIGSTGVDVFTAARQAMRTAKGTDGKTIVGAAPRFMVVGPEIETLAEQILAETYPTKSDETSRRASSRSWWNPASKGMPSTSSPIRRGWRRSATSTSPGRKASKSSGARCGIPSGCPSGPISTSARAGSTGAARISTKALDRGDADDARATVRGP